MNSYPDVIVLGHHGCGGNRVRVHHMPVPGETIVAWDNQMIKDGGKGSHQAIVISRLGGKAAFIGKIGSDEQSEISKGWLVEDGVNIKYLLRSGLRLPQAGLIMVDDDGVNTIIMVEGVRNTLTFEEVKPGIEDFKSAKIFITNFEIPIRTALEGAKLAKTFGMMTILNPAPAPTEQIGELDFIDIIIPNEPEAKSMAGMNLNMEFDPLEASIRIRQKYKVGTVIITLGADGVFGFNGENAWRVPSVPVLAINSTGAGDAFIGSFAWSLLAGNNIPEAMKWGNYYAALSVTKEGTIVSFPKLEEVISFINNNKSEIDSHDSANELNTRE
jgi:ribokinase